MTAKVLSLLEAFFDLISGSSLSMKIQIMGGKITENLGFKIILAKGKLNTIHYDSPPSIVLKDPILPTLWCAKKGQFLLASH